MTKLEEMLRVLKRRNFAGKNGIYDIRYYRLSGPTILGFWVYIGNGVGVRRVTLII
ncbi:hypothetical protein NEUTE1DRAFT_45813 [Neurospora tetrasperma FGSC 2508]|uniref:Uncharacterized protein n=1 Tax=Neurospora tetrasperma (strain FGSC 2508 / ATCC MYA-4615 / P0657) TaxID=510951 RepID=F8MRC5_NEUT8|nr:uncharacterized protein NEUTE1DRAFT_45813 [Neurospora tetrasperma FGSC 2508]EGO56879.1 hypothetical protein NEUTE1DRAFT_45813 [Neurospora tetrasperma FGSC 2508]EGZ70226.1 hypothetical protein NEUTE2DRAFT_130234 [Neurospora tetrasperma FGSC 2509]